MPQPRPTQPSTPARDAFTVHRSQVAEDISLGYVREGVGGYPLLLVHGYPETMRIWERNIVPLADRDGPRYGIFKRAWDGAYGE